MANFITWGERIESIPEELANPQLLGLLRACHEHPDVKLVELRQIRGVRSHAAIVIEAGDGTVAPRNEAGILPRERLCLAFLPREMTPAEVRALRTDFPDVVHLNGVGKGEPASLCLYEDWSFEERRWTPQRHLARILWWLRCTADGTLHAQDQSLEQLFYATGQTVVLPAEFETQTADDLGAIYCKQVERSDGRLYLVATASKPGGNAASFQPLVVDLSAVTNIPIQRAPRTLGELDDHLARMGVEFQASFEAAFKRQFRLSSQGQGVDGQMLLIVRIPRTRDGKIERLDCRGFLVGEKFEDVGIKLGTLCRPVPGGPASVADDLVIGGVALAPETAWRSISVGLVDLRQMPSREFARMLSGIPNEEADFAGVLAGVGSLGSALADIWAREGWGRWTFIDPDEVAPHNLVRHAAMSDAIGFPKVEWARAHVAHAIGHDRDTSTAIAASANDLGRSDVASALGNAQLLVDASTTIAVPRDWAEKELPRSASVFFTYSGMSAVLLLEDKAQNVRLSSLEAQYYRAMLSEPWGGDHLQKPGNVRVGAGCRDHSLVLSYELVKLHAAQLARRLRKGVNSDQGAIQVWTLDDCTGSISAVSIEVQPVRSIIRGDWQVRWDTGVDTKLHRMREACLPSETGGVLLGVIDQKLHTITIVDASDAPPDSSADATSFVRGEGGQDIVSRCEELTGGMVSYVGEWHSHPEGHSSNPSSTDVVLLATLATRLAADGIPALMVIASQSDLCVSLGAVVSER
jgi:integrative and conjugative element protein (TIGR02256 family)